MPSIHNGPKYICDICGAMWYQRDVRTNWKNQIVCPPCYEPKHPHYTPIPAVMDNLTVPKARPRGTDVYVTPAKSLSIWGRFYEGEQGLDPNLTWGAWTTTWGGGRDINDIN